jgi:hypothetical protein
MSDYSRDSQIEAETFSNILISKLNAVSTLQPRGRISKLIFFLFQLFFPLKILFSLLAMEQWSDGDKISFSTYPNVTLDNFLVHRFRILNTKYPTNDFAFLLTRRTFSDRIVGQAMVGQMCSPKMSGALVVYENQSMDKLAATMAHELGHSFGMSHDDASEKVCNNRYCIMNPTDGDFTLWSVKSKATVAKYLGTKDDFCLLSPPTFNLAPFCGNGLLEDGEQCDCGLEEHCDNPCCEPKTCQFRNGAHCASGECCDLELCYFKNAGTLCRPSKGECDYSEYCSGTSEFCPADNYKEIGLECQNGEAYCYEGACRTRYDECRHLFPETESDGTSAYFRNKDGTNFGHCGSIKNTFDKCQEEDILCGLLHCRARNATVNSVLASVTKMASSSEYSISAYWTSPDPAIQLGLAPNGAKCGENRMCVHRKCVDIAWAREMYQKPVQDTESWSFMSKSWGWPFRIH